MRQIHATAVFVLLLTMSTLPALAVDSDRIVPGAITDGTTIYLMRPGGGIEGIDASSGTVTWSSSAADMPLALRGDRLVALSDAREPGRLQLTVIGIDDRQVGPMTLGVPATVLGSIDDGLGRSLHLEPLDRDGTSYVRWTQRQYWTSPIPPGPDDAQLVETAGAARLDLNAPVAEAIDPSRIPEATEELPAQVRAEATAWWYAPVTIDGVVTATEELRTASGQRRLVLRRWDAQTGEALDNIELSVRNYVVHQRSADARHVLVVERSGASPDGEYTWHVHDALTGAEVGGFVSFLSAQPFVVTGQVLVHPTVPSEFRQGESMVEQPRSLVGIDLKSGRELWRRPLRDTRFRGPYPG